MSIQPHHHATQSYYFDTEPTARIGTDSINFKVIGLTWPGFEPAGSGFEPVRFGFLDLPAWEADGFSTHSPTLSGSSQQHLRSYQHRVGLIREELYIYIYYHTCRRALNFLTSADVLEPCGALWRSKVRNQCTCIRLQRSTFQSRDTRWLTSYLICSKLLMHLHHGCPGTCWIHVNGLALQIEFNVRDFTG